jgi:hypothetical protein
VAKHAANKAQREDATRKLLYIYKTGLLGAFRLWAAKAGLHTQRDAIVQRASLTLLLPRLKQLETRLGRKPLRQAFTNLAADRRPKL